MCCEDERVGRKNSSSNTFILQHFHPPTLSSSNRFFLQHIHPTTLFLPTNEVNNRNSSVKMLSQQIFLPSKEVNNKNSSDKTGSNQQKEEKGFSILQAYCFLFLSCVFIWLCKHALLLSLLLHIGQDTL